VKGREVLLAVGGGIAAYKSAALASEMVKAGLGVTVLMTDAARRFVCPLTFETLTGRPVYSDMWEKPGGHAMAHIALADIGELLVVAPATADLIGKFANGIADDLVSTTFLSVECPVLLAPAMNTRMWEHPAVRANVATLEKRGVRFVGPERGRLASGAEGIGRMSEPAEILRVARALLGRKPRGVR